MNTFSLRLSDYSCNRFKDQIKEYIPSNIINSEGKVNDELIDVELNNDDDLSLNYDSIRQVREIQALMAKFSNIGMNLSMGMVDNEFTILILDNKTKEIKRIVIDVAELTIEELVEKILKNEQILNLYIKK